MKCPLLKIISSEQKNNKYLLVYRSPENWKRLRLSIYPLSQ